jgi:hypothetical protein
MNAMKANRVSDFDGCKNPGDYFLTDPNPLENNSRRLSFLCPCGCGDLCGIRVRNDGQQVDGNWGWNGNPDKPTTTPSIDIKDGKGGSHWHGYLTNGEFVPC